MKGRDFLALQKYRLYALAYILSALSQ